jgi:hypothetical protein
MITSTEESDERFPIEIEASLLGFFGELRRRVVARRANSLGVSEPARAATCARRHTRAGDFRDGLLLAIRDRWKAHLKKL